MKNEIKVIANLPIKGMDVIKRCYSGGVFLLHSLQCKVDKENLKWRYAK